MFFLGVFFLVFFGLRWPMQQQFQFGEVFVGLWNVLVPPFLELLLFSFRHGYLLSLQGQREVIGLWYRNTSRQPMQLPLYRMSYKNTLPNRIKVLHCNELLTCEKKLLT